MEDNLLHKGHRERLKTRAFTQGIESLSPHEVLELLIGYYIPRRDVNPLSHRLILKFGTVNNTLRAEKDEFLTVEGATEGLFDWLNSVKNVIDAYKELNGQDIPKLKTKGDAKALAATYFINVPENNALFLMLDSGGGVMALWGAKAFTEEAIKNAYREAVSALSSNVLVLINKPGKDDEFTYKRFVKMLESVSINPAGRIYVSQ